MATCSFPADSLEQQTCLAAEAMRAAAAAMQEGAEKGPGLSDWSALAEALTGALLPLAAVFFLLAMARPIRGLIESRKFTIKFGGMELSAQEASDQLREKVNELATRLAEIEAQAEAQAEAPAGSAAPGAPAPAPGQPVPEGGGLAEARTIVLPPRQARHHFNILWVDDRPSNNALEVSGLERLGHKVTQVRSTAEALDAYFAGTFDMVLSDMGRPEGRDAGLDLLQALRAKGEKVPFGFYTSPGSVARNADRIETLGAFVATAQFVDLLKAISRQAEREGT